MNYYFTILHAVLDKKKQQNETDRMFNQGLHFRVILIAKKKL